MSSHTAGRTILIIDDDKILCRAIKDYFSDGAMEVLTAHTGAEGLDVCSRRRVDVVLLDQKLPDVEGHTLCPSILRYNDQTKIIFVTAYPSFATAVEAVRLGAHDYLSKSFDLEELKLSIEKALRTIDLERVEMLQNYKTERESEETVLIGHKGGLAQIMNLVDLAALAEAPVLITGETGSGKNVVARTIHYRSPARGAAFITINCAALPENLIEAELFGYEKGAFTGASTTRKGIFEMAEGGTLFLDEIGEIPLHLQSKLLGVLEEKSIKRLGGESMKSVDVRVIASTAIDLESVLGKDFREDLYYRLSVIRIHIPPLRERREDITELCGYLLKRVAKGCDVALADAEIEKLTEYDWPGNVRELRNILERAFILQKGPLLRPSEFLTSIRKAAPYEPSDCGDSMTLDDVEKVHIKRMLDKLSHNYGQTARALGISLNTLKRKIRDYRLQ